MTFVLPDRFTECKLYNGSHHLEIITMLRYKENLYPKCNINPNVDFSTWYDNAVL